MCLGCLKMQALHDQDSKRGLFTTPQVIMAQLAPALSLRSVSYVSKQASLPSGSLRLQSPLILSTGISMTGKGLSGPFCVHRWALIDYSAVGTSMCFWPPCHAGSSPATPPWAPSPQLLAECLVDGRKDEQKAEGWMDECTKELAVSCAEN